MKNRLDNQKNMLYKLLCSIEKPNAQVAQSVEQRTENPRVGGSIPSLSTILRPDEKSSRPFIFAAYVTTLISLKAVKLTKFP